MLSANRGMSRFGKEPPAPAGGAPPFQIFYTLMNFIIGYTVTDGVMLVKIILRMLIAPTFFVSVYQSTFS
jgi:hypothetical protein